MCVDYHPIIGINWVLQSPNDVCAINFTLFDTLIVAWFGDVVSLDVSSNLFVWTFFFFCLIRLRSEWSNSQNNNIVYAAQISADICVWANSSLKSTTEHNLALPNGRQTMHACSESIQLKESQSKMFWSIFDVETHLLVLCWAYVVTQVRHVHGQRSIFKLC